MPDAIITMQQPGDEHVAEIEADEAPIAMLEGLAVQARRIEYLEAKNRILRDCNERQALRLDGQPGRSPRGRQVVQVSEGMALASDHTVWAWVGSEATGKSWQPLPPLPQPDPAEMSHVGVPCKTCRGADGGCSACDFTGEEPAS